MFTNAQKILCPIEFNDAYLPAIMLAKQVALQNKGMLYVVHVVKPHVDPLVVGGPAMTQHDAKLAEREMSRLSQEHLGGVPHQTLVRVGDPVDEVLKAEQELGIDLVVMPTHGHTGVLHLLTNGVAEKVIHESYCPVVTMSDNSWSHAA
jgi:universal stress protein A